MYYYHHYYCHESAIVISSSSRKSVWLLNIKIKFLIIIILCNYRIMTRALLTYHVNRWNAEDMLLEIAQIGAKMLLSNPN